MDEGEAPLDTPACLCQKMFADLSAEAVTVIETSTLTEEGVMQVKTEVRPFVLFIYPSGVRRVVSDRSGVPQACDQLLAHRVNAKIKGKKVHDVLNRLHLAVPAKRDEKVRFKLNSSTQTIWGVNEAKFSCVKTNSNLV